VTGVKLSPHFDEREFSSSHGGTLTPAQRAQYGDLCHRYLEPLRAQFGVTVVNSGVRTPEHNRAVGGAPASFHLWLAGRRGVAADVHCARGTPADWKAFLETLNPGGLGAYPTHVHVDNRPGHARW
jgi:uncharacterized protein YcbK (DUF882 family)